MLIDEAAEHLVGDYKAATQAKISDFSLIISVLCYLYPAVPVHLVMREVVRNFSRVSLPGKDCVG